MTSKNLIVLGFVACASNLQVLGQRLLSSACLKPGGCKLTVYFNAASAAEGFNAAIASQESLASGGSWLVWVHQDVFLPEGWETRFEKGLTEAVQRFPKLAVAGVYGIAGRGASARRAGHVLDRGALLQELPSLPCLVDSLDELLFAVRIDSGLRLDPLLGFDFYVTDLVLQAQARGWQCAVVDACCEHWSGTPASGGVPRATVERIMANARVFEGKWAHRLPVTTPCFDIRQTGDVARFMANFVTPSD